MRWPSPILLLLLLLVAAAKVVASPLLRAIFIAGLVLISCLAAGHFLTRRAWNPWQIGIAASIGMIVIDWLTGSLILGPALAVAAIIVLIGVAQSDSALHRGVARLAEYQPVHRIRRWAFPSPAAVPGGTNPTPTRVAVVRDVILVFAIALGVRGIWAVVIPPWQAPDEPVHYLYVAHIVEQGEIPHPTTADDSVAHIIEQGEIPHATTADDPNYPAEVTRSWGLTLVGKLSGVGISPTHELPYLPIAFDYAAARAYQGSERDRQSPGPLTDYPPLYFLISALPYWLFRHGPILSRLFAVRYASVCLGALSCLVAYLMAYELRQSRRWGMALGLAMALMPMHVFITSVANNDAALDLAGVVLTWLIVRIDKCHTVSRALTLAIGVTSGLALLTKPTILPLVVVAGVIVLVRARSASGVSGHPLRSRMATFGVWVASVVLVYTPWVVLRYHYYRQVRLLLVPLRALIYLVSGSTTVAASVRAGYDTAPQPLAALSLLLPHPSLWSYFLYEKQRGTSYFGWLFVQSFWGDFGWLDAPLAHRVYLSIAVVCAIAGIGLLVQIVNQPARRPVLLLLVGLLGVQTLFLFVGVDYYQGFVRTGREFGLQGRYFFPVLAPLLFVLLSGWDHLWGEHPLGLRVALIGMAALHAAALATVIARYYGVVIG